MKTNILFCKIIYNIIHLSLIHISIYEMVAARLLEAFSPHCVKEMTEVALSAGGDR